MKEENVGKYLKRIRENLGLTQEEVGKSLNLGRDAILRIEAGKRKVSAIELVNFSKLYGISLDEIIVDEKNKKQNLKGIILAGGSGTRLYPITEAISKQLLPVYDKPMIYYPLSVLMQAGIRDILIITTKEDQPAFKRLLKDGKQFGINLSYIIQPSPDGLPQAFILGEEFIGDNPCAMILGDNIFEGNDLESVLQKASINSINGYATVFGYKVRDPRRFGVIELDEFNNVLSIEEKPENPKSNWAMTGLYFFPKGVSSYAKTIKPGKRGELEITTLDECYLKENKLKSVILSKEYTWFDTGTFESLLEASNMIKIIENRKETIVACPEIIAYKNGWINKDKLEERADLLKKNSYGQYLSNYLKDELVVKE